MEKYLIVSIIANIAAAAFAAYLLGNNKSLARTVKLLFKDKIKLQSRLDLINNKLATRAGLPLKEAEKKADVNYSPSPKIVSAGESIARLTQQPKPVSSIPVRRDFWTETKD